MTTASAIYEVRELRGAEELLAELSPVTGAIWREIVGFDAAGDWLFRGQSNSADGTIWKLAPTAQRDNAFFAYGKSIAKRPPDPEPADDAGLHQRIEELVTIEQFADIVDRHGLVIPHDSPTLRERSLGTGADLDDFPPRHLLAVAALAQHHGIPTRLLDWTWKPLVASFFAARGVARRHEPGFDPSSGEAPFSVFALRRIVVEATLGLDPSIRIVRVPTATNANLHAQGGEFTLVQPSTLDVYPLPNLDALIERHAEVIADRDVEVYGGPPAKFGSLFPLLVEFRVPAVEARCLLGLLAAMGITSASVFPGLGGCAEAMREPRYYEGRGKRDRRRARLAAKNGT